jgi:[ribosomal protein S5]-alanine N-acetyltransferase
MLTFHFQPFPVIHTERLVLRQITHEDVNEFLSLRSNVQVLKYLDRFPLHSKEEVLELIQKITDSHTGNDAITWAIGFKENPVLIGTIGLWKTDKPNHRAEIGYMLMPEHQRKGIIQEAMTATINYGFNSMKLHSIEANINPANEASKKLLEKNGFAKEAYFRENYYFDGRFLDSVIYSLLAK